MKLQIYFASEGVNEVKLEGAEYKSNDCECSGAERGNGEREVAGSVRSSYGPGRIISSQGAPDAMSAAWRRLMSWFSHHHSGLRPALPPDWICVC